MAQDTNDFSVTLPDALRAQFDDVQRRLWRVETTVAVATIIAGLLLSVLALFVSDRIWNTPTALRVIFLMLGACTVVGAIFWWAQRWIFRPRTMQDLAHLVQRHYGRLGDRLLGIVELAEEQRHQANFSPALYHAAIHQVAEEAREYDFRESVSTRPAQKFAAGAVIVAVCCAAVTFALPEASWNALLRWIAPTSGLPRYTLVVLDGFPHELIVAHGEPFAVFGNVRYRSFWKPARVSGELLTPPAVTGRVQAGEVRLEIPGQVENGLLRVRVGDGLAAIKITPVHRPALRELEAKIQLPEYLHYPDQTQTVESGSLLAVEGSRISFHGKVSRTLASALMEPPGGGAAPLKIDGDAFTSPQTAPDGMAEYTFNWRDDLGLSNAAPLRLSVAMQKDAPPVPDLPGLPHDTALLVSDVLHIHVEASDDFGVRDLGLNWQVATDTPLAEGLTTEAKVMTTTTHTRKAAKTFLWSPRMFRIPADSTVELQGYARDYFPERERVRTSVYHISVLSPEEHAELVRGQLEDALARIEEVTRLQEKIAANLRELQDAAKMPDAQKSARLGQSKNDQLENSSNLDALSQQAQRAVQEAMKNPVFPPDTIHKWTQSAQQWQQLAQDKMKEAAASMQAAQQSSKSQEQQNSKSQEQQNSSSQSQQNSGSQNQQMADAAKKAEDILKSLEQMQQKATKHMDDLHALTLAQRLHKISAQEKDIGSQLIKSASDTIGLPAEELTDKLKHFEHALTSTQDQAQKESDALQGEISRFFERTQKTNYGAVTKEMKDSHTGDELEHVRGLIGDNIGVEASADLGQWSDRFEKWGNQLEPKPDDSGSGPGQSGNSQQQQDLTEQLIALLRLRENEMNLRDQTSVLDQEKGEPAKYKERATDLSDMQTKYEGDLEVVHKKAAIASLQPAFSQTSDAMETVESILRKPDTGKPADDSELKTVDALSDLINLINEQAQRSNPQSSSSGSSGNSAEEMAFLMRLMQRTDNAKAMAMQPARGLNQSGGGTSQGVKPINGGAGGKAAGSREVDKASGVIENFPTEFRDALDNYFHGIENTKD